MIINVGSFSSQSPFLAYSPKPPGVKQSTNIAQTAQSYYNLNQRGLLIISGLSSYITNTYKNIQGADYSLLASLQLLLTLLCHAPAQGANLSKMRHLDSWVSGAQWDLTSGKQQQVIGVWKERDLRVFIPPSLSPKLWVWQWLCSSGARVLTNSPSSSAPTGTRLW